MPVRKGAPRSTFRPNLCKEISFCSGFGTERVEERPYQSPSPAPPPPPSRQGGRKWEQKKDHVYARNFRSAQSSPSSSRSGLERRFVAVYPWAHFATHLVALAYRAMYLLGRTAAWSPSLHALGLRLTRHFPEPPPPPGARSRLNPSRDDPAMCSIWGFRA